MSNIKTSVIIFPANANISRQITCALEKTDARALPHVAQSIRDDIEVISISENGSGDSQNVTAEVLKVLEDNKTAYDQTLFDESRMDEVTISVRFFNGSRSSTKVTGKDKAIASHIRDTLKTLEMAEYCEDMNEMKMNLQVQLFAKTTPPLVQGIDLPPVE